MTQSIGLLSRKMVEAKTGGEEASKAFKGIEFLKHGKLKPTEEVLGAIADKFHNMKDGAAKIDLSMELFGRAGKQMIPLLNQGSKGLDEMRQEARDLGLVMSKEAIEASENLVTNFTRLKAISQGLWRGAISPLLPAINKLVERFLAWRKANAEIMRQKLQAFLGGLIKAIEILGQVFLGVAGGIEEAMEDLKRLFDAIGPAGRTAAIIIAAAWAIAAAPFLAVAAAIGTVLIVLNSIRRYREGKDSLFGDWAATIADWQKPNENDPWWLKAIKELVKIMERALGLAKKLGLVGNDSNREKDQPTATMSRNDEGSPTFNKKALSDPNSYGSKFNRARAAGMGEVQSVLAGLSGPDVSTSAAPGDDDRGGFDPWRNYKRARKAGAGVWGGLWAKDNDYQPTAGATPEYRGAGSGGSNVRIDNSGMQINISQQPGEDSEALASRVRQVVGEELQSTWSDAYSGVSR